MQIKFLINIIKCDLLHYYNHSGMLSVKKINIHFKDFAKAMLDIDFRVVFLYRVATFFIGKIRWIGILIYFRIKSRYGCDLSPFATIGKGLRLVHAFGIVVGPDVVMGDNCLLFCGVVLGNRRPDQARSEMPLIGNQVIIGAGAKVLGNVKIEDLKLIGANLVVTQRNYDTQKKAIIDIVNRP